MIPVNYSNEFQDKRGSVLKSLYEGENPIVFIANGTYWNNSFFVVNKDTMLLIAEMLKDESFIQDIKVALDFGRVKLSNKYKNLINSRWSRKAQNE